MLNKLRTARQAKSMKGDKKLDKMLEGLNYLSNSILEVLIALLQFLL